MFLFIYFYTPPHDIGGALWLQVGRPCVCLSVRPSVSCTSVRPSVRFLFPDDNLSKHQWIFKKLVMCIDIVEIWFGIANGQISSIFTELSACDTTMAGYYNSTFLFIYLFIYFYFFSKTVHLQHC